MYAFIVIVLGLVTSLTAQSSGAIHPYTKVGSLKSFFFHVNTHRVLHRIPAEEVLVWLDWDKTLVDERGRLIDDKTKKLIKKQRAKGYKIIVNTSRGYDLGKLQDPEDQKIVLMRSHRNMSSHRIDLEDNFNLKKTLLRFAETDQGHFMPTYFMGYLFAGISKYKVLHQFLDYVKFKPKMIFGLDDVPAYLDQFPKNKRPVGDSPGYRMFHFE